MNKKLTVGLVAVLLLFTTVGSFALGRWGGSDIADESAEVREEIRILFTSKNITIDELKKAYVLLDEQIESRDHTIKELRLEALEDGKIIEAYYNDIENLNKKIIDLNTDVDKMADRLEAKEQEIKDGITREQAYMKTIEKLTKELEKKVTELEKIGTENNANKATIKKLEMQVKDLESQLKQAMIDVTLNLTELKAIVADNK